MPPPLDRKCTGNGRGDTTVILCVMYACEQKAGRFFFFNGSVKKIFRSNRRVFLFHPKNTQYSVTGEKKNE